MSQVADAITTYTLAHLLVFNFNSGPSTSAMATALIFSVVPLLLVGPFAGRLADSYKRKLLLVRGQNARAIITFLSLIALLPQMRFLGYASFAILLGLTRILYTARVSSFPYLIRRHELVAGDSTSLIFSVIAGAIGASIGFALVPQLSILAFCFSGLCHLASAIQYDRVTVSLGGGNKLDGIFNLAPITDQFKLKKTRLAMIATASHRFLLGLCLASVALLVDNQLDMKSTGYVMVLGFSASGSFLGSVVSEWMTEHFPRRILTSLTFLGAGGSMITAALFAMPKVALFAIFVTAFFFQVLRVRSDATIQANVKKSTIGQVFAAYDILYNLAFASGATLGIVVSGNYSFTMIVMVAGFAYFFVAILLLIFSDQKQMKISPQKHPSAHQHFSQSVREIEANTNTISNFDINFSRPTQ